jgi:hypothetical protein
MADRYFLYLAPGYHDEAEVWDVTRPLERQRMIDHGADEAFLDQAEPGDFQPLHRHDRWIIRLARCWPWSDDEEQPPHG